MFRYFFSNVLSSCCRFSRALRAVWSSPFCVEKSSSLSFFDNCASTLKICCWSLLSLEAKRSPLLLWVGWDELVAHRTLVGQYDVTWCVTRQGLYLLSGGGGIVVGGDGLASALTNSACVFLLLFCVRMMLLLLVGFTGPTTCYVQFRMNTRNSWMGMLQMLQCRSPSCATSSTSLGPMLG